MFEMWFKEAKINRSCELQQRSAEFVIHFRSRLEVRDFDEMPVFLQEGVNRLPGPGGVEAMLYTVTLPKSHPVATDLGVNKVIIVGEAFMRQSHTRKLILLKAEALRQRKDLTENLARPDGIKSSTLDREVAAREALAWEFSPSLIQRTLGHRDQIVAKSVTKVNQGIYAGSDDHYKKPWFTGKEQLCHPVSEPDGEDVSAEQDTEPYTEPEKKLIEFLRKEKNGEAPEGCTI